MPRGPLRGDMLALVLYVLGICLLLLYLRYEDEVTAWLMGGPKQRKE